MLKDKTEILKGTRGILGFSLSSGLLYDSQSPLQNYESKRPVGLQLDLENKSFYIYPTGGKEDFGFVLTGNLIPLGKYDGGKVVFKLHYRIGEKLFEIFGEKDLDVEIEPSERRLKISAS